MENKILNNTKMLTTLQNNKILKHTKTKEYKIQKLKILNNTQNTTKST